MDYIGFVKISRINAHDYTGFVKIYGKNAYNTWCLQKIDSCRGDIEFLKNPAGSFFLIVWFILFLVRQRGRDGKVILRLMLL